MSQHIGDLIIKTEQVVAKQVTGTTIVKSGGHLIVYGQLAGGLIIENGGYAIVHGQVSRNLINDGKLVLHGQVTGRIVGNPPINKIDADQVVGTDLEVPFRGVSRSWNFQS